MRLFSILDLINKQIQSIQETSEGDHQHMVIKFKDKDFIIISSTSAYEDSSLITDTDIESDSELKEILKNEI